MSRAGFAVLTGLLLIIGTLLIEQPSGVWAQVPPTNTKHAATLPPPTRDPNFVAPDRIVYISCLLNGVGPGTDLHPFKIVDSRNENNTATIPVGTWVIRAVDADGALIAPDARNRILIMYRNGLWWIAAAALKQADPNFGTDCDGFIPPIPSPTPYQPPTPLPPTLTATPFLSATPAPPTPTPLPTMPRATFDPSHPLYDAGRFKVPDIHSVFGSEAPAVIGSYRFYGSGTLDLVPHSLEQCVDASPLGESACYKPTVVAPGRIGASVYAPAAGCAYRLAENPAIVIIVLNCEGRTQLFQTKNGDKPFQARREIVLDHLDPDTTKGLGAGTKVAAGQYIGSLCSVAGKADCKIRNDVLPYLSVQVRFTADSGPITPENDEVIGFLAAPNCIFDDYNYSPGKVIANPKPIAGCPLSP